MTNVMRSLRFIPAAAALAALTCPTALRAQISIARVTPPRWEIGVAAEYAHPVSQFRQNVEHGFGGGGHVGYHFDPAGVFSLRADVGYLNYGKQSEYFVLPTYYGYVDVQQETSNNILVASIGPQLAVPVGPIRPYVNAGVGFAYFYTETSLNDADAGNSLASQTDFSDNSLVYSVGAGVTIPLAAAGQNFGLDLGARYHAIGRTRYLTKGDITADPNTEGQVIITPHESEARFLTYQLGITVAF